MSMMDEEELHEIQELDRFKRLGFLVRRTQYGVPRPKDAEPEVCFKYFSKFPPEIRLMIWELAIPVRVVNVWNMSSEPHHLFTRGGHPAPPVAHACRESRYLARRSGRTRIFGTPMEHPRMPRLSVSWFDSHRDTLRIEGSTAIEHIPRCSENIIFCWPYHTYQNKRLMDMKLTRLPKLKSARFELDYRFVPSKIWNTWEFLQGPERAFSIILDIDDEAEVQRFADTLRHRSKWQYSYWFKEIGLLRDDKFDRCDADKVGDWKVAQKQLQNKWIEDREADIKLAKGGPRPESSDVKMPKFSRVISLISFPEKQYEDGAAYWGKDRFVLFDVTKKPEPRAQPIRHRQSVSDLECWVKCGYGWIPDHFRRIKTQPLKNSTENKAEQGLRQLTGLPTFQRVGCCIAGYRLEVV
ncbi:hypothetical protein CHU98_g1274 [Xylaria longipes]|nr:hypothetical protein CHU98_g1274 [Xylaria longipes]